MNPKRLIIYLNKLMVADVLEHEDKWAKVIVTPYKIDFEKEIIDYYWENGPTRSLSKFENFRPVLMFDDSFKDPGGFWDWDKIDLFFLKNYRTIEKGIKPDFDNKYIGWIAPNGDYYSTRYGNHDSMAKLLVAHLENTVMSRFDAREHLLKTWLQVMQERYLIGRNDDDSITEAQTKTVKEIADLVETKDRLLHNMTRRTVV